MPTTFTHDVFGKEVFSRLSEELKQTIRQGKDLYRIGLHGPDIFFYYHPLVRGKVYQIGHTMHYEEARGFFERSAEEWAAAVDEQMSMGRKDTRQAFIDAKYDINEVVKEFVSLVFQEEN